MSSAPNVSRPSHRPDRSYPHRHHGSPPRRRRRRSPSRPHRPSNPNRKRNSFKSLDSELESVDEDDAVYGNDNYTTVQQTAYFLLKMFLIAHMRVLCYCFKIRTGEIKKPSKEKKGPEKVFQEFYEPTVHYLHKIANEWNIRRDWSNWTKSKLKTLAVELKEKMERFFQVCKIFSDFDCSVCAERPRAKSHERNERLVQMYVARFKTL